MAAMQRTLEDFLRALRAMEVNVSPAEAIDAHRAVAEVGYGDRTLLKDALCVTVAKTAEEVERFDAAFDTFFTRDEFKGATPPQAGQDGAPQPPSEGGEAGGNALAEMLLSGDAVALSQAMEAAAARARASDIRLNTQRALLA